MIITIISLISVAAILYVGQMIYLLAMTRKRCPRCGNIGAHVAFVAQDDSRMFWHCNLCKARVDD